MVIDRGLLTFDLVTRLSQVIKSANSCDINVSNKIIDRLIGTSRCLRSDCRLSSTLEQSTITLLLDLATTNEVIRAKIMAPLLLMLDTIGDDARNWCDKFESDFGKTFLYQLLRCDPDSQEKVSSRILVQLDLILIGALSTNVAPRELIIVQGIFDVIGTAPQYTCGEFFKNITDYSQRATWLTAPYSQDIHFSLASSVLTACTALVEKTKSDYTTGVMDSYRKAGLSMLPRIVEIAASVLSGTHEDDGLKRRAVLLLVACTRMNVVHREFAFQHGMNFLRGLETLVRDRQRTLPIRSGHQIMASESNRDDEEAKHVQTACHHLFLATEVVAGLRSILSQDRESCHHLTGLSSLLRTACLNMHFLGTLHRNIRQKSFPDSTGLGSTSAPEHDCVISLKELKSFSSAAFLVMRDEEMLIGVDYSSAKIMLQMALKLCNPLSVSDGLSVIKGNYTDPDCADSVFRNSSRDDSFRHNPYSSSENQYYTVYRMISLIGSAVEAINRTAVLDIALPALTGLLSHASSPPIILLLTTQLAKLAAVSLTHSSSITENMEGLRLTPSQGPGSGMGTRGKRGTSGAHWDLVIECMLSTYSRTVRSIKDLTVDAVDSVAPPTSHHRLFPKGFGRKSGGGSVSSRSQVGDMFRAPEGWNESEGVMFGGLNRVAISESALLSVLEGVSGGLDILISQVRELGRWDMVRSLRGELVRSFTAMAVDLYSTDRASENTSPNTLGGMALGLLLRPLASSFGRPLDPHENTHKQYNVDYRGLWTTILLLRIKEQTAWNDNALWQSSLQQIAIMTPPLVLGPKPLSHGFQEYEFCDNPVVRSMSVPSKSLTAVLHLSSKGAFKEKNVLKSLKSVVKFNLGTLPAGQAVFLTSVQLLESFRAGGSTMDLRPMILYLGDPSLDTLPRIRDEMAVVADYVFTVFIDSACERLKQLSMTSCSDVTASASAPTAHHTNTHTIQTLQQVRGVLSQIFEFFTAHCTHALVLVRTISLKFTGRMLDRLSWLISDSSAVRMVLNCLKQLGSLSIRSISNRDPIASSRNANEGWGWEQEGVGVGREDKMVAGSSSGRGAWHSALLPPINLHCTATTVFGSLLPRELLPIDSKSIGEASLPLLEMAYIWLFTGMRTAPSDLSAILQEYVLMEQSTIPLSSAMSHTSLSCIHVGIAMAKECATHSAPLFHMAPPMGETTLWEIRGLAAFKVVSQLPVVVTGASTANAKLFDTQLALKTKYREELRALHSTRTRTNTHTSSYSSCGSSLLSRELSPPSTPIRNIRKEMHDARDSKELQNERTYYKESSENDTIPYPASTYTDLAMDSERAVRAALDAWETNIDTEKSGNTYQNMTDSLVRDMWRVGCAVHLLYTDRASNCSRVDAIALRVVQVLCEVPSVCFTVQTVDCLVAIMQWFLVFAPSLRRIITSEISTLYIDTAKKGLGMFASPDSAHKCEESLPLLSAQHYSGRLIDFVDHPDVLLALQHGSESSNGNGNGALPKDRTHALLGNSDPRPHVALTALLEQLLRTDAFNTSLAPLFQCVTSLLAPPLTLSSHPFAISARFKLLCLSLRIVRKCLVTAGAPSGPQRRVLRERIISSCLSYFESPPVWLEQQAASATSAQSFSAIWTFLTLLLEDTRTWTVEYPKGGLGSGQPVMSEHRGESGKFGSCSKSELVANKAAGVFLQKGRCVGSSGAMNYLSSALGGHDSVSPPVESCVLPVAVTSAQGELGIFCPVLTPCLKPFPALEKSKRLINVLSATVGDAESGTGMASGVLCLVKAFTLHELDRISAWSDGEVEGEGLRGVLEQSRTSAAAEYKVLAKDIKAYKLAVRAAWAVSPVLALALRDRFPLCAGLDGRTKGISTLSSLCVENPGGARHLWQSVPVLLSGLMSSAILEKKKKRRQIISGTPSSYGDPELGTQDLLLWASAPVPVVISMLTRIGLNEKDSDFHLFVGVVRYCTRSLCVADPEVVAFYMPQLVQLLRRDHFEALKGVLMTLAKSSALLCHRLVGLLRVESYVDPESHSKKSKIHGSKYGHCNALNGQDPLPQLSKDLLAKINESLSPSALEYLKEQREFFDRVTDISARLKLVKNKLHRKDYIASAIEIIVTPSTFASPRMYLPTDPLRKIIGVDCTSGIPMQSAAKCPFLLSFHTVPWGGPDEYLNHKNSTTQKFDTPPHSPQSSRKLSVFERAMSPENQMRSPQWMKSARASRKPSLPCIPDELTIADDADYSADVLTMGIPCDSNGTSMGNWSVPKRGQTRGKGHSRHSMPMSPLSPERYRAPRLSSYPLRSRQGSSHSIGAPSASADNGDSQGTGTGTGSGDKHACIFKVYDDCRQDALVVQVVQILRDEFLAAGLPLYLVPYSVIPSRTGADSAPGGIIQVIPNVKSRDQIGKAGAKDILEYYTTQFGPPSSPKFKEAQRAFINSMAGYAIVCYILSIKDRHNGNLLIDNIGHAIHIDYGFILGISPGGNLGFETAAFKITADMIALMGGQGSSPYELFVDLVVKGFLVARGVMDPIMDIVLSVADSGLPCFLHKEDNLEKMKARFMPEMTPSEAAKYMRGKANDAADKWTTNAYDGIQKLQNNIH